MNLDYLTLLELRGIDTTEITEETLNNMIKAAELEITARTGLTLHESEYTQIDYYKYGQSFLFDYFPVISVQSIDINQEPVDWSKSEIDKPSGIIYLASNKAGILKTTYTAGLTDEEYETLVAPIILNLLDYSLDTGWDKNASSIKEGNVSVSIDSSLGKGALINSQIENLRNRFNITCRLI